jgi:hypothetical protein
MEFSIGNRSSSLRRLGVNLCAASSILFACAATAAGISYSLEVLPPEHRRMADPKTGAALLFLTTAPENDSNLYFPEYSWLADESGILFTSSRTNGGLMGYVTATGELIRFNTPQGPLGAATAAAKGNAVLAVRGRTIVEVKLAIQTSDAPTVRRSGVTATERVLCALPDGAPSTALNPSCDGKYVALGVTGFADKTRGPTICKINLKTGKLSEVCRLPPSPGYGGHVQWSRTNPNLISFAGGRGPTRDVAGSAHASTGPEDYAGSEERLWVVDVREGVPRNVYRAEEGDHALRGQNDTTAPAHRRPPHLRPWRTPACRVGSQRGKVVFGSHLLGGLNVCVATIPKAWEDAVSANNDGLRTQRK